MLTLPGVSLSCIRNNFTSLLFYCQSFSYQSIINLLLYRPKHNKRLANNCLFLDGVTKTNQNMNYIQPFHKHGGQMKQSLAGYIRQHLSELETRMEYGISQTSIVEEINQLGYSTTVASFRVYLSRARTWRIKKLSQSGTHSLQSAQSKTVAQPKQTTAPKPSTLSGLDWQGTMKEDDLI
jgi:hypothetical protein